MDKTKACLIVLNIEKQCVQRAANKECDRQCEKCDLVLPVETITNGYDEAIRIIKFYQSLRKMATGDNK